MSWCFRYFKPFSQNFSISPFYFACLLTWVLILGLLCCSTVSNLWKGSCVGWSYSAYRERWMCLSRNDYASPTLLYSQPKEGSLMILTQVVVDILFSFCHQSLCLCFSCFMSIVVAIFKVSVPTLLDMHIYTRAQLFWGSEKHGCFSCKVGVWYIRAYIHIFIYDVCYKGLNLVIQRLKNMYLLYVVLLWTQYITLAACYKRLNPIGTDILILV